MISQVSDKFLGLPNNWDTQNIVRLLRKTPKNTIYLFLPMYAGHSGPIHVLGNVSICHISTHTDFQNTTWWSGEYITKYMQNIHCFPPHPHRTCSVQSLCTFSGTKTTVFSSYMFYMIYYEATWVKNGLNAAHNNIQWHCGPETHLPVPIFTEGHSHWFDYMGGSHKGISTLSRYLPANVDHGYIQDRVKIHVLLFPPSVS